MGLCFQDTNPGSDWISPVWDRRNPLLSVVNSFLPVLQSTSVTLIDLPGHESLRLQFLERFKAAARYRGGISRGGGGGCSLGRDEPNDGAGNAVSWAGAAPRARALLWGGAASFLLCLPGISGVRRDPQGS